MIELLKHNPSPPSHPDSLECWYLRYETAFSISAAIQWGDQTWGIPGRYLVAEDASVWGLRNSGMRANPSACRVLTSDGM